MSARSNRVGLVPGSYRCAGANCLELLLQ